jgi:hypothetical protein
MDKEIHLIPYGVNTYLDVVAAMDGVESIYVFREGQTPEEFWSELEAAEVRAKHGLSPGRAMPTAEEIAAGPLPLPPHEPDPRDTKIADLESRVAKLEAAELDRKALNLRD